MAVSYVQDMSELARIVQQGLMGGMQQRQRRDAMNIQEAELEAQRQRDIVRQQQEAARFGLQQQEFEANQGQREVANSLNNAYLTLANTKFAGEQQMGEQERQSAVRTRRSLQGRIIDRLQKTGQGDPITIGHVWDTEDLPTLRAWDESATKMEQGKLTLEGMRKSARGMRGVIGNIVRPDGTPDTGKQNQLKFLSDNVENEADYKRFMDAFDDAMKMQGEAQAEQAKTQQQTQNIEAYRQSRLANGATPGQVEQEIAAERAGMAQPDAVKQMDPLVFADKQAERVKDAKMAAESDVKFYADQLVAAGVMNPKTGAISQDKLEDVGSDPNVQQAFIGYWQSVSKRKNVGTQQAQQPQPSGGQQSAMPPDLIQKAKAMRQRGMTPDQIKASLEADGWRFE